MQKKFVNYLNKILCKWNISPLIINIFLIAFINLCLLPGFSNLHCYAADSLNVRNAHVMAYDEVNKVVLLFGGADERQVLNDLWAWNGKEWSSVSTGGGPSPRTFPALAYDSARKQLILFGGNRVLFGTEQDTSTFLDDMWGWYDQKWHQIKTKTPSARAEASIAYDSNRKCIVLFGGYRNENGERIRLGDTWEWNGKKWEERFSEVSPPPRNGTAMAYDSHRKKLFFLEVVAVLMILGSGMEFYGKKSLKMKKINDLIVLWLMMLNKNVLLDLADGLKGLELEIHGSLTGKTGLNYQTKTPNREIIRQWFMINIGEF